MPTITRPCNAACLSKPLPPKIKKQPPFFVCPFVIHHLPSAPRYCLGISSCFFITKPQIYRSCCITCCLQIFFYCNIINQRERLKRRGVRMWFGGSKTLEGATPFSHLSRQAGISQCLVRS